MAPPPRAAEVSDRLRRLAAILTAHRDVVVGRVDDPAEVRWATARGWDGYLLGLGDDALARAERAPALALATDPHAPADLRALAREVEDATRVRRLDAVPASPIRGASESKRAQVAALREALRHAGTGAGRVIDVGAGRGHLTRALSHALELPAVGIERRPEVVEAARALGRAPLDRDLNVRFEAAEVDDRLAPRPDDLLVGLHACGALGDALIRAAAVSGARALLVPCCPQKIDSEARAPISALGRALDLAFAGPVLGLANRGGLGEGPVSQEDALGRRERRRALRRLLRDAGVSLAPGDEARGINRKRFRGPLTPLVEAAFDRRGLPMPSARQVAQAERDAAIEHARARRLSVARALLARPLELALALDRAALLAEAARPVEVVEAFARAVSPRNLAIVALA